MPLSAKNFSSKYIKEEDFLELLRIIGEKEPERQERATEEFDRKRKHGESTNPRFYSSKEFDIIKENYYRVQKQRNAVNETITNFAREKIDVSFRKIEKKIKERNQRSKGNRR